jgi:hypothetical protein
MPGLLLKAQQLCGVAQKKLDNVPILEAEVTINT